MSIAFIKLHLYEKERKLEAQESDEDDEEDDDEEIEEDDKKIDDYDYDDDDYDDCDKDNNKNFSLLQSNLQSLRQEHFKTSRGEAISSNSVFHKRHQRLREDDMNSTNSTTNSMTNSNSTTMKNSTTNYVNVAATHPER